jgi:hypothetical protein
MESSVNDTAPPQTPNRFLANLTLAMKATAETAQVRSIEKVRADAAAYVEHLRTAPESGTIRELAEADVATIRERSKQQMERVRAETEQRVTRRHDLLQQELAEFNTAVELETERVKERVAAFQTEVTRFFDQLLEGADPTVFASMASQMPDPPDFIDLDRAELASELRARREQVAHTGAASPAAGVAAK